MQITREQMHARPSITADCDLFGVFLPTPAARLTIVAVKYT